MAGGTLLKKIPEFSAVDSVKIAPNTSVPMTRRLRRIIDTRTFQRLRKIRQLSLSDRVFPSATHTRFSHALGVFNNVLDYLRHLDNFPEFHRHFTEQDYVAVILAALLHDLGHYPCSHQLDHIPPFPEHERLTVGIIRGEIQVAGENMGALIRDAFGISPDEVALYLDPELEVPPEKILLKQLIDSPIDADKCDYLPRDSYFCGVDYGTGFDRERFIRNLVPGDDGRHLCVHEKGLMTAERFQLARYWMYSSVYWGHTVRAYITMMARACEDLDPDFSRQNWPEQLLYFNDYDFLEWLYSQVREPGRELVGMIRDQKRPYKRLYTLSYHHAPDVYEQLRSKALRTRVTACIQQWIRDHGYPIEPHYLIWDVPPRYKSRAWETFPVKIKSGEELAIADESPVIEALGKAFLHRVRKIRLFCHPALAGLVENHRNDFPDVAALVKQEPVQSPSETS